MQGLVFSSGIVRLGGIFVAPLAFAASIALTGCSGTSGGGTAPGDDGTNAGDDAASTSPAGDDADTTGSSSGQSASSSGSNSGGSSNGGQDDSGGSSGSTASNAGAPSVGPGRATDAGSPGATSGGTPTPDAGTGSSNGSSGSSGSSGGSPPASTATFTQVFNSILGPTCVSCHGIDAPMMSFSVKATAYADLVGVAAQGTSCRSSGETRVVAGSSATSLLYMKVAGTQTCGVRMPENRTPLSAANIALIKNWIDQGAMNN